MNQKGFHKGEYADSWPFADPKNVAAWTLRQVLEGAPILFVSHDDDDGSWFFSNGDDPLDENLRIVSLFRITQYEPEVKQLADLPYGWQASRTAKGQPWRRDQSPPEDAE